MRKNSKFIACTIILTTIMLLGLTSLHSCKIRTMQRKAEREKPTAYIDHVSFVDPFIGTDSGGHTYPGAVCPFGMVSVSPHNDLSSPSGYTFGKNAFYGLGHIHLSGAPCPEFGNIVLTAISGTMTTDTQQLRSTLSNERAEAGYYAAEIDEHAISFESTASLRTGITRFVFGKEGSATLIFDIGQSLTKTSESFVEIVNDQELVGYSTSGGFCSASNSHTIYFAARWNKKPDTSGTWKNKELSSSLKQKDKETGAWFTFGTSVNDTIEVKVALSFVSMENAKVNLLQESNEVSFDKAREMARKSWSKELSKINVHGSSEQNKKVFYTALYHSLLHPNIISDCNGDHITMRSKKVKNNKDQPRYSTFALSDTYKTLHPLFTLIYPEKQQEMVASLLSMYEENGWLPKMELAMNETHLTGGDPGSFLLTDTYLKGIKRFDTLAALEAMLQNAYTTSNRNKVRPDLKIYLQKDSSVLKDENLLRNALEYLYADWCTAQYAKMIGELKDHKELMKRLELLQPFYHDSSFMAINHAHLGNITKDRQQVKLRLPYLLPIEMDTLVRRQQRFNLLLQNVLDDTLTKREQINNLSLAYYFTYIDEESWRSQLYSRKMTGLFHDGPSGLPGCDRFGALSSQFVFAAMGFYPDRPGFPLYRIGSPIFDRIDIVLDNKIYKSDRLILQVQRNNEQNIFIKSMVLNGKKYDLPYFTHQDLTDGCRIIMDMGNTPLKK